MSEVPGVALAFSSLIITAAVPRARNLQVGKLASHTVPLGIGGLF